MAAPVGHIVCALAFLNIHGQELNKNAFLAGTSFPDIRYITEISRRKTHWMEQKTLEHVLEAKTSFEAGRRFHVFVDHEREKFMKEHDAYRFLKEGDPKTQLLKLVEDHILYEQINEKFDEKAVFSKVYPEELAFGVGQKAADDWHKILVAYLSPSYFDAFRYFRAIRELKNTYYAHKNIFSNFWSTLRSAGFLVYAYTQVLRLSSNPELREIILKFYLEHLPKKLAKKPKAGFEEKVLSDNHDPPLMKFLEAAFN